MRYALIDLGGVLFTRNEHRSGSLDWEMIDSLNSSMGDDLDIGRASLDLFVQRYNELAGAQLTSILFLEKVFSEFDLNRTLLEAVSQKLTICIASDNYKENVEFIKERFRLSDWTHKEYYSYSLGNFKSEQAFFTKVMSDLGCEAGDCLFIDDSIQNINAASSLGIRTIHFRNNEQAITELNNL